MQRANTRELLRQMAGGELRAAPSLAVAFTTGPQLVLRDRDAAGEPCFALFRPGRVVIPAGVVIDLSPLKLNYTVELEVVAGPRPVIAVKSWLITSSDRAEPKAIKREIAAVRLFAIAQLSSRIVDRDGRFVSLTGSSVSDTEIQRAISAPWAPATPKPPMNERLADAASAYLAAKPGMTGRAVALKLNTSPTNARQLVHQARTTVNPETGEPFLPPLKPRGS